jgi:hypothetical protein
MKVFKFYVENVWRNGIMLISANTEKEAIEYVLQLPKEFETEDWIFNSEVENLISNYNHPTIILKNLYDTNY